jgi:phosphoribosylformylglycinamidine synthase
MDYRIEVFWNANVADGRGEAVLADMCLLGVPPVKSVRVNDLYSVRGDLSAEDIELLCHELLVDPVVQGFRAIGDEVIQSYKLGGLESDPRSVPFAPSAAPQDVVETIPIREMEDEELAQMTVKRVLFLNLAEMRAIRIYYRQQSRAPTDIEMETLAQTWSNTACTKRSRR